MIVPERPRDEVERLRALYDLGILDTPAEERFDRITRLAQRVLGAPITAISLIDRDRQWFKSIQGLDVRETTRDVSFCGHAVAAGAPLVVPDATRDERFQDNPLVADDPSIRAYAGYPFRSVDGRCLGTLCAIDRVTRAWTNEELDALKDLAQMVEDELRRFKPPVAGAEARSAAPDGARVPAWSRAVLLVGIVCSLVAFEGTRHWERSQARSVFERLALSAGHLIETQFDAGLETVHFMRSFYHASNQVDADEFRTFVTPSIHQNQGILGLEWVPRIRNDGRADFEDRMRRDNPGFRIFELGEAGVPKPASDRDEFFPVMFYESRETGMDFRGFDLGSEKARRSALHAARDDGQAHATERLVLIQGDTGVLVVAPVYRDGDVPASIEQRRSELAGFVAAILRIAPILEQTLPAGLSAQSAIVLEDRSASPGREILYRSIPPGAVLDKDFQTRYEFEMAGRRWALSFEASSGWIEAQSPGFAWLTLLGGLVITLITWRWARSLNEREAAIERTVAVRTAELSQEAGRRTWIEQQLLETSLLQKAVLDAANYSIISTTADGTITSFNAGAERMLGYSAEDLVGAATPALIHVVDEVVARAQALSLELGRDIEPGFEVFVAKARNGQVDENDWTYVRKDGTHFPVRLSVTALKTRTGEVIGFLGIAQDLSDVKSADRRFHLAMNAAPNGMLIVDAAGLIQVANRQVETIFGYSPQEITGRPVEMFLPEFLRERHEGLRRSFFDKPTLRRMGQGLDLHGLTRDGRLVPIEIGLTPFETPSGPMVLASILDVTERKEYEARLKAAKEEAEAATRTKSEFLANMSHELRTPLNSVIGFANVLLKNRDGRLVEQELTFLRRILENGKHLLGLINSVLDLSKVEAGRMELHIELVAVDDVAREVADLIEIQVQGRPLVIERVIPPVVTPIRTDAVLLRQILTNLVGNAVKFTERGFVRIEVETDETAFPKLIRVSDSGIGIPPERLREIFEPFRQAESTTARRFGGAGLGLTITRAFCERLDFDLKVESRPGEGTVFTIEIPKRAGDPGLAAAEAPAAAVTDSTSVAPASDPPRQVRETSLAGRVVLVVDDEEDARTLMKEHLEENGCTVLLAESGSRGLELARSKRPDAIMLDLMMPEMSGWEVLAAIKADASIADIPVIIASFVGKENRTNLREAFDILDKPVSRESLRSVLERNLPKAPRP